MEKELNPSQNAKVEALLGYLHEINSVTVALQNPSIRLNEALALLDGVMNLFPQMSRNLDASANIVVNLGFEAALVKILNGQELSLSANEQAQVSGFLKEQDVSLPPDDSERTSAASLAARILKRKREETSGNSKYVDLIFIASTSNICERLFSLTKRILTDTRSRMLPVNFESLVYPKCNRGYWNVNTFHNAMK